MPITEQIPGMVAAVTAELESIRRDRRGVTLFEGNLLRSNHAEWIYKFIPVWVADLTGMRNASPDGVSSSDRNHRLGDDPDTDRQPDHGHRRG